ncbi:MAG: glycosyltransferase family 1 protein [Acidobacteriota bacterium]
MRFSVDAHAIGCHLTGNEVYIRNLLKEFARLDQDCDVIAYISKPRAPEHIPERFQTRWVSANPYKRLAWDIPNHVNRDRPDLLHVQYTGPLRTSVPLVVSIHDVSYLEHPEYFTQFRASQLRITVKRTAERAAKILTPSEFSKRAILKYYGNIPDDRIVVVPNAVSNLFRPVDRETARLAVESRLGTRQPFILTVGDLQPRKNHLGLLKAFEDVLRSNPQLPHHLVFVGKETWYSAKLHQAVAASALADRVHFTGFVEDDELVNFYGACDLFVYPSFYEGFGLPILEAMACGRAVACSHTTAMPEVADSAGLLFDPRRISEIARAMHDILIDPELRVRLERLGQQRAAAFSWQKAAERTLQAYYEVAGAPQPSKVAVRAGAL